MITVLHGEDTASSYERLNLILKKLEDVHILNLSSQNTYNDLVGAIASRDFFEERKVIVCQNFIKDKKIGDGTEIFKNSPEGTNILFWEQSTLTPAIVSKIQKIATVEVFKKPPRLFWFLDSLAPDYRKDLQSLSSLQNEDRLLWNVTNRLLLLIFAKLNLPLSAITSFTNRRILDWQWQKILSQAKDFELSSLINIYRGLLKLDYLIKTGKTNLEDKDLIPFVLLKYLQV